MIDVPRFVLIIAVFAVTASACGAGQATEEASQAVAATSSTVAPTTAPAAAEDDEPTTAPEETTTTAAPAPAVVVDGPPAPDFALALDDGRGFILSEEQKPVYMVFWAEW